MAQSRKRKKKLSENPWQIGYDNDPYEENRRIWKYGTHQYKKDEARKEVDDDAPISMYLNHLNFNTKGALMEQERMDKVEMDNRKLLDKLRRIIKKSEHPDFCRNDRYTQNEASQSLRMTRERLKCQHENIYKLKMFNAAYADVYMTSWSRHYKEFKMVMEMRKRHENEWYDHSIDRTAKKLIGPSVRDLIASWGGLANIKPYQPNSAISSSAFSQLRALQVTEQTGDPNSDQFSVHHCPYMHMTSKQLSVLLANERPPARRAPDVTTRRSLPCPCRHNQTGAHGEHVVTTYFLEIPAPRGRRLTQRSAEKDDFIVQTLFSPYIEDFCPRKDRAILSSIGGCPIPLSSLDRSGVDHRRYRAHVRPHIVPRYRVVSCKTKERRARNQKKMKKGVVYVTTRWNTQPAPPR